VGLPPPVTAATGMDALTHALESYLSRRANPWLAGVAMAGTGLGICHAIGHSLGGRWGIAHGVALSAVLPAVLRFNLPARVPRLADIAFALGAGDSHAGAERNAAAAIEAVAALRDRVGLAGPLAGLGVAEPGFAAVAADALADEVLANTPRAPTGADIAAILRAS
jgi:alcohol dehydrogenase